MINPLDSQYRTLQDIFAGLRNDEDKKSDEDTDIYPILLEKNATPQTNSAMKQRLLQLFVNGISSLPQKDDEGRSIPNSRIAREIDYPVPGEKNDAITPEDIQAMINALSRVLPEPEDADFNRAVADRKAGMVKFLGVIVDMLKYGRDTGATLRNVLTFSRPANRENALPLKKLPWEGRKEILEQRTGSLQKSMDTTKYRTENNQRYDTLEEQYSEAGLEEAFKLVRAAFERGKTVFAKGDTYKYARWTNVLYTRLARVDCQDSDTAKAELKQLTDALTLAQSEQEFTAAIDSFKRSN